eukprot:5027840-Pyramimonas_sp.AAC.1
MSRSVLCREGPEWLSAHNNGEVHNHVKYGGQFYDAWQGTSPRQRARDVREGRNAIGCFARIALAMGSTPLHSTPPSPPPSCRILRTLSARIL